MSEIITDKLTGKTSAGDVTITDGSATMQLQQGLAKSWVAGANDSSQSITGDTFNVSGFTDTALGTCVITITNLMNSVTYPVQNTATANYDYHGTAISTSTYSLRTVGYTGNSADGAKNGLVHGDLA
jgi:hypothetical protein